MKLYLVIAYLVLFSCQIMGQSFEGRLFYEQKWQGKASAVEISVGTEMVHILRDEAIPLHYVLHKNGALTAWGKGAYQPTQTNVKPSSLPLFKPQNSTKIIAGFQAKALSISLSDGSELSGWYTTEIVMDYNHFIAPIQGEYWGAVPEKGILLVWKVVSAKGDLLLEGKLTNYSKESLTAEEFSFR